MSHLRSIEKILVLRNDGIGDVLNSTPAMAALRSAYPGAHISVVARPLGAEVLFLNPHIDKVLVYDSDGLHKDLKARLRFLRQLRAGQYDMAVALRNSSGCNFMVYFSGARYRIGRKSERKRFSFALTHWVSSRDPKGEKHEIDRNMDVVKLVGAENSDRNLVLRLSEEERIWAQDSLRRHDVGARGSVPLVGIHPGGSTFDKLWPAENFAYIANRLMEEFGSRIILFSGPGEDALAEGIQRSMSHPPIFAAGIGLRQFAALVGKCSLFLCNDSGPMHIAAALKVPTVAIFGPTDHVRWRPCNERAAIVRKNMDCWPCSAHKCKRKFECTKSLPVSDVWDSVVKQQLNFEEVRS